MKRILWAVFKTLKELMKIHGKCLIFPILQPEIKTADKKRIIWFKLRDNSPINQTSQGRGKAIYGSHENISIFWD